METRNKSAIMITFLSLRKPLVYSGIAEGFTKELNERAAFDFRAR